MFQLTPAGHIVHHAENFTLNLRNDQVFLLYEGEVIMDITEHQRILLTSQETVSYRRGVLSVASSLSLPLENFPDIQQLVVYNGTHMQLLPPDSKDVFLITVSGQLLVCQKKAFYSSSVQLNRFLNEKLLQIFSNTSKRRMVVEFKTLLGNQQSLLINGTSVIILNDVEFRSISDQFTLLYLNQTLCIHNVLEDKVMEIFPAVKDFFLLDVPPERLEKYTDTFFRNIPGNGHLYVHQQTNVAFYCRDTVINDEISDFITHQMQLSLYQNIVALSLQFKASVNSRRPFNVLISANGDEIVQLVSEEVVDRSISPQHYLLYNENAVFIMEGSVLLDSVEGVFRLSVYDESKLLSFTSHSTEEGLPGGGQLYVSRGAGFYSLDTEFNDRIGEALLSAEKNSV